MNRRILLFGLIAVPIALYLTKHYFSIKNKENPIKIISKKNLSFANVSVNFDEISKERAQFRNKYNYKYNWNGIDRRDNLTEEEFNDIYSEKWPVIITDCGTKWPAFKKWNKTFFTDKHSQQLVAVKTHTNGVSETFSMPIYLFINHLHVSDQKTWTYINDEMFLINRPELLKDLGSCPQTGLDYFTLFPIEARPWWSFFLWGTRYSRSELHMDPYNWTGTNFVISGHKRWKLYPPGQDHLLNVFIGPSYRFPLNSYKYNSNIDAFDHEAETKWPLLSKARVIEFDQKPGELLIIPTGWFHQAYNEEETLAVSGQMMNKGNYKYVLEELFKGGDLNRDNYDSDIFTQSSFNQVKHVLGTLSRDAINRSIEATKLIYSQLKDVAAKGNIDIPPLYLDGYQ